MKIFYNPKTLKIMGMSDGETTMDFPFVETEEKYHSTGNLSIKNTENGVKLEVANGTFETSVYNQN